MGTVAIRPMSFSVDVLVVLAAMLFAAAIGNRLARAGGVQVESTLWLRLPELPAITGLPAQKNNDPAVDKFR